MNDNQFLFNYDENNNYEIFNQEEIIPDNNNLVQNHQASEENLRELKKQTIPIREEFVEPKKSEEINIVDLIVIGAGWSGILACKNAKEKGLNTIVLEARSVIGGVWKFSEDPKITTTIKNAHSTSSKTFTEMSDFPMPKDYPSFPSHKEIYSYLIKYVNNFKLAPHIIFNTKIEKVVKIVYNNMELWKVYDSTIGNRTLKGPDQPNSHAILDIYEIRKKLHVSWGTSYDECNEYFKKNSIKPLALVNCLNYGHPQTALGDLVNLINVVSRRCEEDHVPVIGGNVSLYNSTDGKNIYPTPVLVMVGVE